MARGRQGFYLEGWKFAVYLAIPLGASWYFNDPARQKESADYWQYMKYPANPNTNMKEQIEELKEKQNQRQVYREQMKELHKQAQRTTDAEQARISSIETEGRQASGQGWLRWIGLGGGSSSSSSSSQ
jgi:hypothetical protein